MQKYTIPTILIAIVLVAGIFALMPLEKASTVHTTILANLEVEKADINFAQDFTGTALVAGAPVAALADDADNTWYGTVIITIAAQGAGNKVLVQTSSDGGTTPRTILDSGDNTAIAAEIIFTGDLLQIDCGAGDTCALGATNTIIGTAIGFRTG